MTTCALCGVGVYNRLLVREGKVFDQGDSVLADNAAHGTLEGLGVWQNFIEDRVVV